MTELQKLEKQVAELQATIERMKQPEFTYPMWFKHTESTLIVMFTDICNGKCVAHSSYGIGYSIGDELRNIVPHTDTSTWTQIPEPIKQWEPQGGNWYVSATGFVCNGPSLRDKAYGAEYSTKEHAEWARDQMRSFNRLLCYVAEFDVDENGVQWMPDWEDPTQPKCAIVYDNLSSKWSRTAWNTQQHHTVHISKKCAEGLVDKLNRGEVVL